MLETSGLHLVTTDGQPVMNCIVELTDTAKQLEREVMKVRTLNSEILPEYVNCKSEIVFLMQI